MDAFVAQQLALISIDDEAVCEYVARLVEDGDIEEEERREVVSEFLSASTEEPVEAVVEALFAEWRQRIAKVDEQADAARQQAFLEAREREKKELAMDKQEKQNTDSNNGNTNNQPPLSTQEKTHEERVRRNQTLARYGYGEELIEQIDDEDEATAKAAAVTAAMLQSGKRSKKQSRGANAADIMAPNINRAIIEQTERVQRETLRQNHQKKVERDRDQLEKQKLNKETDKKKKQTQKQEKRRM